MVWLAAIIIASPAAASVANPIAGRLTPESAVVDTGATVRYRLELSTFVAFQQVAVRLKVPEGMALVTGAAQARIVNFVPGETRVFEYELKLLAAGEKKVWFEAEVMGLGGGQILRQVFLGIVNPSPRSKENEPTIVKDRQGNSYQVQGISPRKSQ